MSDNWGDLSLAFWDNGDTLNRNRKSNKKISLQGETGPGGVGTKQILQVWGNVRGTEDVGGDLG